MMVALTNPAAERYTATETNTSPEGPKVARDSAPPAHFRAGNAVDSQHPLIGEIQQQIETDHGDHAGRYGEREASSGVLQVGPQVHGQLIAAISVKARYQCRCQAQSGWCGRDRLREACA